jgi:hypothetical protein
LSLIEFKLYLNYNRNQIFWTLNLNAELKIFIEMNCNYVFKMWLVLDILLCKLFGRKETLEPVTIGPRVQICSASEKYEGA